MSRKKIEKAFYKLCKMNQEDVKKTDGWRSDDACMKVWGKWQNYINRIDNDNPVSHKVMTRELKADKRFKKIQDEVWELKLVHA